MKPPDHDTDFEKYEADRRRRTLLIVFAFVAALVVGGGLHLTGVLPPG
jgi:hydrogenase/urease accessory protein HupE